MTFALQLGILDPIESLGEESKTIVAEAFASDPSWASKVACHTLQACQSYSAYKFAFMPHCVWKMSELHVARIHGRENSHQASQIHSEQVA